VHGRFTARMESDLVPGRQVWIKMPYGDFVIDRHADVALFAGGTGITAFTAFLDGLTSDAEYSVTLAYGARTRSLLIYRGAVERCTERIPSFEVSYFVERQGDIDRSAPEGRVRWTLGRVSVEALWSRLRRPFDTAYYISGPPPMLKTIGHDLRARDIAPESIHIDAWE
jgi:ferredoxin-NADP reductase